MENVFPKWAVAGVSVLLMLFLALAAVAKYQDLADRYSGRVPKNTMTVTAEGKVKAVPDMATINLGVVTQGPSSAAVQDESSKKVNKIIDFVKQQGVSKDDISTSQFNIYPQYNYKDGKNDIVGYEARQTIVVQVKGVDKSTQVLAKILADSTQAGANEISGVSLGFDDPDNLKQTARAQAIEKAKARAEELAKVSGLSLGRVVSVSQAGTGDSGPMPYYGGYGMGGGGSDAVAKSISPNIEPGSQDVTESMTLTFEVK